MPIHVNIPERHSGGEAALCVPPVVLVTRFARPFDDTQQDFEKMWCFLQQDYAQKQDRFTWLVSRLGDWRYGLWNEKKYIPTFFRDYAQLWVDSFDQLVGFVLSENGDNIFFIFTARGMKFSMQTQTLVSLRTGVI